MRLKATPRVTADGMTLELERPLAAVLAPGRPFHAHFHGGDALLLLREQPGLTGFLAGSLSAFSVEEVFGQVLAGVRTGHLVLQHGAVRKTVTFRDGQVVFASSTERHERLGASLVRLGLITAEQLHQALTRVSPGTKLGQALTRAGILSETRLYNGMTFLVREIILDLFEMVEGSFLFLEGVPPDSDALKLPERTRELVLQGLKRGQKVQRLRRAYPDEQRLRRGTGTAPASEGGLVAKVAEYGTVGALRSLFEGSHFAFLHWLDERCTEGSVSLSAAEEVKAPAPQAEAALGPEERYCALLSLAVEAFQEEGKAQSLLTDFLEAPPEGLEEAFDGVSLSDTGVLDLEQLRRNLQGPDAALSRALVLEALDAFLSYTLFTAKNVLSQEASTRLSQHYRSLQEAGT